MFLNITIMLNNFSAIFFPLTIGVALLVLNAKWEVKSMRKKALLVCAVAVAAAYGQEFELKWDNGNYAFGLCYEKGFDVWYANDFDASGRDSGYD